MGRWVCFVILSGLSTVYYALLKGQCHEMDIFWRSEHFNQYFLIVCADGFDCFQGLSKLFTTYTIINFLFASLQLLSKFENAYWNPPQKLILCDWSMFSTDDLSLACVRTNLSRAASGMILQNHRWLPVCIFSVKIAVLGSLKWVTGTIFISSK